VGTAGAEVEDAGGGGPVAVTAAAAVAVAVTALAFALPLAFPLAAVRLLHALAVALAVELAVGRHPDEAGVPTQVGVLEAELPGVAGRVGTEHLRVAVLALPGDPVTGAVALHRLRRVGVVDRHVRGQAGGVTAERGVEGVVRGAGLTGRDAVQAQPGT